MSCILHCVLPIRSCRSDMLGNHRRLTAILGAFATVLQSISIGGVIAIKTLTAQHSHPSSQTKQQHKHASLECISTTSETKNDQLTKNLSILYPSHDVQQPVVVEDQVGIASIGVLSARI